MKLLPLNTDRIIQTIDEENFFSSELIFKLYSDACIVVADSCCQILILFKKDMNLIGKKFPSFDKNKIEPNTLDMNMNSHKNVMNFSPALNNQKISEPFRKRSFKMDINGSKNFY